jgi:large subunit ribosomal protein L28
VQWVERRAAGEADASQVQHGAGVIRTQVFCDWSDRVMAQVCEFCGKGPQFGNNISHAHNVTRRRWNPNLQTVKAKTDHGSKRIRVCTSCIKSGKIVKV